METIRLKASTIPRVNVHLFRQSLNLLLVVVLCLVVCSYSNTDSDPKCPIGWFGKDCEYMCRCRNELDCDTEGNCFNGSCTHKWFGPQCQYKAADINVTWSTHMDGERMEVPRLSDDDPRSCVDKQIVPESKYNLLFITLVHPQRLSWFQLSITSLFKSKTHRYGLDVVCLNAAGDTDLETNLCPVIRVTVLNNTLLEVYLRVPDQAIIHSVMMWGQGLTNLCEIFIPIGRNVALRQKTGQTSTLDIWEASNAVDGRTAVPGNRTDQAHTCTHTANHVGEHRWFVQLARPVDINRIDIYNRVDPEMINCCEFRLKGFTLKASLYDNVKYIYNDTLQSPQNIYHVKPGMDLTEPVDKIEIYASAETDVLTLCEVEVFADSNCEYTTGTIAYGRECEKSCKCNFKNQKCLPTGGCMTKCKHGEMGPTCSDKCYPGFYYAGCMWKCEGCNKCDIIGRCPREAFCVFGFKPYPEDIARHCKENCFEKNKFGPKCNWMCHCKGNCSYMGTCLKSSGVRGFTCGKYWLGQYCQYKAIKIKRHSKYKKLTDKNIKNGIKLKGAPLKLEFAPTLFTYARIYAMDSRNLIQLKDLDMQDFTGENTTTDVLTDFSIITCIESNVTIPRLNITFDWPTDLTEIVIRRIEPNVTVNIELIHKDNVTQRMTSGDVESPVISLKLQKRQYLATERIYIEFSSSVTLCEVAVFGVWRCARNYFSFDCERQALLCPRSSYDGLCIGKCNPGYHGRWCEHSCKGTYGPDCKYKCPKNCREGICDVFDGTCLKGCEKKCNMPHCREGCDKEEKIMCGKHCFGGTRSCDFKTGLCSKGCKPGYIPPKCQQKCKPGFYGAGCKRKCSATCGRDGCNHISGYCNKCPIGKEGVTCNKGCKEHFYGEGCKSKCSDFCRYRRCNKVSGVCTACVIGRQGELCDKNCSKGFYGDSCVKQCSRFCNGTCNHKSGICGHGCRMGYIPPYCRSRKDVKVAKAAEQEQNYSLVIKIIGYVWLLLGVFVIINYWTTWKEHKANRISRLPPSTLLLSELAEGQILLGYQDLPRQFPSNISARETPHENPGEISDDEVYHENPYKSQVVHSEAADRPVLTLRTTSTSSISRAVSGFSVSTALSSDSLPQDSTSTGTEI